MVGRALLLTSIMLLAGCMSSDGIAGQGSNNGTDRLTVACDSSGNVVTGIQGTGNVKVVVQDGAGLIIFEKTFNGSGQQGTNDRITGQPGDWVLTATFSGGPGSFGSGFQGQWAINLTC